MNSQMIQQNAPVDRASLMRGMALLVALLQSLPKDALAPKDQDDSSNSFTSRGGATVAEPGLISFLSDTGDSPLDRVRDSYLSYEERPLRDGRTLRQYENGNTRIYSADNQVIQEERDNGNFMVSLPTGRVLYQEQPGEPLMVMDAASKKPLGMARVVMVTMGEGDPRAAYTFIDGNSAHFVDVESLKHYRVGPPAEVETNSNSNAQAEPTSQNTTADGRYAWVNWNHLAGSEAQSGPNSVLFNTMRPVSTSVQPARPAFGAWR